MCSVTVYSVGPSPAKPDSPVSKTGQFRISSTLDKSNETMTVDPDDWRTPLGRYLENPSHIAEEKFGGSESDFGLRWCSVTYMRPRGGEMSCPWWTTAAENRVPRWCLS
jgi:hypothetical protein